MRTQRHEEIYSVHAWPQVFDDQSEEQRQRHGARGIGNDHQHALIVQRQTVQSVRDNLFNSLFT